MSPLRIVGFGDDASSGSLYPVVFIGEIPDGETILIRARDPFGVGEFYSLKIRNGYGEVSSGTPILAEGEPDNSPIEAATLNWGTFLDRGFDPLFDEDWFTFTSSGECCNYIFATTNASGSAADPILEIYNPTPNLGAVTYTGDPAGMGIGTYVAGVFDPNNNLTLIGMFQLFDTDVDVNSFSLVFSGPPAPGDYPVRFAAPPFPGDAPGTVTGSIHIDQYDGVDGRIIGSFDITIVDDSRVTTVSGNFDTTRETDEPGLLAGFRPGLARATSPSMQGMLKEVSAYMRRD